MKNYFRRYDASGTCVVICLQCFETIGSASDPAAVATLEGEHKCAGTGKGAGRTSATADPLQLIPPASLLQAIRQLPRFQAAILLTGLLLAVYAIPTLIELFTVHASFPGLLTIFLGDVVGCACLALIFRKPAFALTLYLGLSICETVLYQAGVVGIGDWPWLLDVVPTLVVAREFARLRTSGPPAA